VIVSPSDGDVMSGNVVEEVGIENEQSALRAIAELGDVQDSVTKTVRDVDFIYAQQTVTKWGEQPGPDEFMSEYRIRLGRVKNRLYQLSCSIYEHSEEMKTFITKLDQADKESANDVGRFGGHI
jgi:hypothetical protein